MTWREPWLNLAPAEQELGLPIADEAIQHMRANLVHSYPPYPSIYVLNYVVPGPYTLKNRHRRKRGEKATQCHGPCPYIWAGCPCCSGDCACIPG
ncbi:hypothetical protein SCLCIDRAFT_1224142 [Scleroderma citrinum Foug A]|uniref:Uncharacterized protein n=1 Tax=Scleroderma citrinum Foug A TaxID=1036808 RepID=A0A0C3D6U1_9AGAM|nr:hypothetical protein SCLCIDRAFT_1224142 [Scleroderma citrinum Foug A]